MHSWQTDQLHSLIAALYLENFADFRRYCHFNDKQLLIALDASRTMQLSATWQAAAMLPMTITSDTVTLTVEGGEYASLITLSDIMTILTSADWWPVATRAKALRLWQDALQGRSAVATLTASDATTATAKAPECSMERLAMQIDRPHHPFAHAKGKLLPLFTQQSSQVDWWAVPSELVFTKQAFAPATLLLPPAEQAKLAAALAARLALVSGAEPQAYLALPALESERPVLTALKQLLLLNFQSTVPAATSSLRSFYYAEHRHLKFATSQATLGAKRTMPPRYLHNGDAAYALLQQILNNDAKLQDCLQLCDEQNWWASGAATELITCQGELAAQLRVFPATGHATLARFTMAALNHPGAWCWLHAQGFAVYKLWLDLCTAFTRLMLTLWHYGVLPECHGQNIQIWLDEHQQWRFILRDHDTLRICTTQLKHQQLPVPDYQINWHSPNTLVLADQTKLLSYFTTLGIQINLYPIALAISRAGFGNETLFWQHLRQVVSDISGTLPGASALVINEALLSASNWPFKAVLSPLLNADEQGSGMPSAITEIANPWQKDARAEACHAS